MARKIIKRRRHRPVRVSSVEKSSDGETVIVTVVYREKSGHVRVRRMREPVVQFGDKVRQRDGMAVVLRPFTERGDGSAGF